MTLIGWVKIAAFLLVLLAITKPFGSFMAKVFQPSLGSALVRSGFIPANTML